MKFDIVLIDDHSLVLEGLKTLLRDIAGVNSVCTVTNGTELLSLIKSRIFHIYITDLELPDIDGFELMHSIKENNPQAKIIVCTMHEEIWIVNKLRHPDINAVVFKSSGTEAYVKRCVPLWWMKTIIVSVISSYIKRKAGRTMKPSCRICCLLRVSWMY